MNVYMRTKIVYSIDVMSQLNAPAVLTLSLYYHDSLGEITQTQLSDSLRVQRLGAVLDLFILSS